jgi:hypothetical protein
MIRDDEPSTATDTAQPALPPAPGSGSLPLPAGRAGALIARRTRLAASRRRPWWKWLMIGVLLACSVVLTALYAVALIGDISRHHWAAALDASRDAVPAAVGWAGLLLLFYSRSTREADRLLSADNHALSGKLWRAARDQASMDSAEHKVRRLSAKLAELTAARQHERLPGEPDPDPSETRLDVGVTYLDPGVSYLDTGDAALNREVAETTARLEQARQWLASAQAAVAASQRAVADAEDRLTSDFPDLARLPDPAARRPA